MKIGDKLYYVSNNVYGPNRYVVVKTIGRKWFTVEGMRCRFSVNDLTRDGGKYHNPGRCYTSREVYDKQINLSILWRNFQKLVRDTYSPPCGESELKAVLKLLNLQLDK